MEASPMLKELCIFIARDLSEYPLRAPSLTAILGALNGNSPIAGETVHFYGEKIALLFTGGLWDLQLLLARVAFYFILFSGKLYEFLSTVFCQCHY